MRRFDFQERHLGTPVRLVLVNDDEAMCAALARAAFDECARIERTYSRFLDSNALSALNTRIGEWVELSAEFYHLLSFGEEMKRLTEGAFDLSVKSILEGWGYDAAYSFAEGEAGHVGVLEMAEGRVRLSAPIELGGLGKGHAIDSVAAILAPLENFLIDAGGDLLLRGHDEKAAPWRVAFEHPTDISQAIGLFEGSDLALACSSPSRRHWKSSSGEKHHLVDPRTGKPAAAMQAVYTQADTALVADAYSTALFVLGFEKACSLLPTLPVEALLVGPQGELFRSSNWKGDLFTA